MNGMISSSAPSFQRPKLSPMSQLRSMNFLSILSSRLLTAPAVVVSRACPGRAIRLSGTRAGAHPALGEQDTLVEQPQEDPERRLGVLGTARAIVRQRPGGPVQAEE